MQACNFINKEIVAQMFPEESFRRASLQYIFDQLPLMSAIDKSFRVLLGKEYTNLPQISDFLSLETSIYKNSHRRCSGKKNYS